MSVAVTTTLQGGTTFMSDSELILEPCDIFLTKGEAFVSRAIRYFTRSRGEPETVVNHVGLIVEQGSLYSAKALEALAEDNTVKLHTLSAYAGLEGSQVTIFRPLNLTPDEKKAIVEEAKSYQGKEYGFFKILGHVLDWCLGGKIYFFRRLFGSEDYPICSWVVAKAFAAADKNFDVDPGAASPDCIMDFVTKHKDKYQQIRELKVIPKEEEELHED